MLLKASIAELFASAPRLGYVITSVCLLSVASVGVLLVSLPGRFSGILQRGMFWDYGGLRIAFRWCYPLVWFVSRSLASVSIWRFGLLRRLSGGLLFLRQPRHHGWTWRRPRKRQLRFVYQDELSQVTSRCLSRKHPANDFGRRMEERKMAEDGGGTVVLVRGRWWFGAASSSMISSW